MLSMNKVYSEYSPLLPSHGEGSSWVFNSCFLHITLHATGTQIRTYRPDPVSLPAGILAVVFISGKTP